MEAPLLFTQLARQINDLKFVETGGKQQVGGEGVGGRPVDREAFSFPQDRRLQQPRTARNGGGLQLHSGGYTVGMRCRQGSSQPL